VDTKFAENPQASITVQFRTVANAACPRRAVGKEEIAGYVWAILTLPRINC